MSLEPETQKLYSRTRRYSQKQGQATISESRNRWWRRGSNSSWAASKVPSTARRWRCKPCRTRRGSGSRTRASPSTAANDSCSTACQMRIRVTNAPKVGPGTEHRHRQPRLRVNFNSFDYFLYRIHGFFRSNTPAGDLRWGL